MLHAGHEKRAADDIADGDCWIVGWVIGGTGEHMYRPSIKGMTISSSNAPGTRFLKKNLKKPVRDDFCSAPKGPTNMLAT
jgi:hypothetical protein